MLRRFIPALLSVPFCLEFPVNTPPLINISPLEVFVFSLIAFKEFLIEEYELLSYFIVLKNASPLSVVYG